MQDSKIYYYRRGAVFSYKIPDDLDEDVISQTKFMQLTREPFTILMHIKR